MNRFGVLLSLVALAFVPKANATLPASPEQMLCQSSYIFTGRVLHAQHEYADQVITSVHSTPRNPVKLTIEVRDILGAARPPSHLTPLLALSPGDMIQGRTQAIVIPGAARYGGKFFFQGDLQFDARRPTRYCRRQRSKRPIRAKISSSRQ
jgi:hypothetical protein